ncbi:MAG: substrate-binding domain-containing protein [Terracidiphilus sp.]|nr:substrate-binding domain-containing protein [Terracidiphilus sp.]
MRQPLAEIGRIATQVLLNRIHGTTDVREDITVEPELVVRDSTGPVHS